MKAHDPSRGRNGAVLPPDDIMTDIKALSDWAVPIRDKQKAMGLNCSNQSARRPCSAQARLYVRGSPSGSVFSSKLNFDVRPMALSAVLGNMSSDFIDSFYQKCLIKKAPYVKHIRLSILLCGFPFST